VTNCVHCSLATCE